MFISIKVTLIRILKMVTSIKTDQKVTLMMKMRRDHQTLNGAKIGDVRTEGGQSRPRRSARNPVLVAETPAEMGITYFKSRGKL